MEGIGWVVEWALMDRVGDGRVLDGSGRAAEVFWMVCVGSLSKGGGRIMVLAGSGRVLDASGSEAGGSWMVVECCRRY